MYLTLHSRRAEGGGRDVTGGQGEATSEKQSVAMPHAALVCQGPES